MEHLLFDSRQHYWDRVAADYDHSLHQGGGAIAQMLTRTATAVAGCQRVLEVGAGTGLVTRTLARQARQVVATDYSRAMVHALMDRVAAEGLNNVKPFQIDLYALPDTLGSFDAVVAANVLHLVPDLAGALTALGRSLQAGGRLIVPTVCHGETALASGLAHLLQLGDLPWRRQLTTAALAQAVVDAGFDLQRVETLRGWQPVGFVAATKRALQ